ncbi:large subunit ribosomal protein L6 [Bathymodiolus platifrons methanotrophic gill symbiont]|uniref:50S ribosomal protein L6 n=1 Tax=Bathymodiolus platifrons methanotrophic gill symbiont TaxID=113268 RepID=UPI000B41DF26|nr:50S ribosomal protein L6 [Bathymodiolus platifrons methanotrophic gill symbiont]GAW85103.1 large subunit ribosomal protein L6 [Bathymodiolus platifrons methanotrophic gill symbiont]
MSRIAKNPITLPAGVEVKVDGSTVTVKGSKGLLSMRLNSLVQVDLSDSTVNMKWDQNNKKAVAQAGTARANIANMVTGVTGGFEKKLNLVGVGYRAQVKGKVLNLSLGFSHPVEYRMPEEIVIEAASQTELVVKGIDKQLVGAVSADIRAFRPPEPYKGKGVKYADEHIVRKDAKKK